MSVGRILTNIKHLKTNNSKPKVDMKYHIHDIKFIRMFVTQNNCTVCPKNQTHSVRKCWKSPFVEYHGTHLNTGAATFPVNMFMLAENLLKNIHLPFPYLFRIDTFFFSIFPYKNASSSVIVLVFLNQGPHDKATKKSATEQHNIDECVFT